MANQIVCDRCGCVLCSHDGILNYPKMTMESEAYLSANELRMVRRKYDVCRNCYRAISTFFNNELVR